MEKTQTLPIVNQNKIAFAQFIEILNNEHFKNKRSLYSLILTLGYFLEFLICLLISKIKNILLTDPVLVITAILVCFLLTTLYFVFIVVSNVNIKEKAYNLLEKNYTDENALIQDIREIFEE